MATIDYTSFDKNAPKSTGEYRKGEPGFWWREKDPTDRAGALVAAANELKQKGAARSQANLRHARLYGNFDAAHFGPRDYTKPASDPANRLALNVTASCVDALTAKIAKTRPRPAFITDAGNYIQHRSAKRLDKFWQGVFYEADVYQVSPRIFKDGCVFDVGCVQAVLEDGRLRYERVLPDELFVDDVDGYYGMPRQIIKRRLVAKEVLLADPDFTDTPEKRVAIAEAKAPDGAMSRGFGDCVEVFEAWHLRSSKKSKDGVHCIAIDGCELFSEDWKLDCFPLVFFRFADRMLGFWGQSLVERLAGIQLEINRLLRSLSEQLRRKGRGRVFCPAGSKVVASHLTNAIGDIVYYHGPTPPTVDNSNAIAPEEFAQLDRLYQRAFQEAGISELSAAAKKPSGLDAAVALREFNDIESERFAMVGKAWEQFHMDLAKVGTAMLEAFGVAGYKVRVPGQRSVEVIEWSDVKDVDSSVFVMKMFPVSSLPQTPGHRLQRVQEMEQAGYIDKATARRLLDFPDIDAENQLAFAAQDDVDAIISAILDQDDPELLPPDDFTDPLLLVERATAAYLRAKHMKGIEPERLQMLIDLIDMAQGIMAPPPTAPAPDAPGTGMPAPMGAPPAGPLMTGGLEIQNNVGAPGPAPMVPPLVQ